MYSIIIPVYNSENTLSRCLESALNLDFENYEVIAVVSPSPDNTGGVIKSFNCGKLKVIFNDKISYPSVSRNKGALAASFERFVFTDSDCVLPGDFLKRLTEETKDYSYENYFFGIDIKPYDEEKTLIQKYQNAYALKLPPRGEYSNYNIISGFCHSAGMAVEKSEFFKAGGFDEDLRYAEDHDLAARFLKNGLKLKILKTFVYHINRSSFRSFTAQAQGQGQGVAASLKKHFNKNTAVYLKKIKFLNIKFPFFINLNFYVYRFLFLFVFIFISRWFLILIPLYFLKQAIRHKKKFNENFLNSFYIACVKICEEIFIIKGSLKEAFKK